MRTVRIISPGSFSSLGSRSVDVADFLAPTYARLPAVLPLPRGATRSLRTIPIDYAAGYCAFLFRRLLH